MKYVDDADFTLYVGDVRDCLRELPDESVHCVVTSPPYWGLRAYLDDDHPDKRHELGLEPTPEAFVAAMVDVFREVRRVLRQDGTCFVNIGDSYWNGGGEKRDGGHGFVDGGKPKLEAAKGSLLAPRMEPVQGWKPKDLCGIPWRVAFALQADGWYLRSDIVWSKPNPMPESVTDRPTKAHEYVFLLTRSPRYFFDQEAVREPHSESTAARWANGGSWAPGEKDRTRTGKPALPYDPQNVNPAGRNVRSVWEIATQPYPEAHFATFPEALPERCIKAGTSERGCCPECGAPWERVTEKSYEGTFRETTGAHAAGPYATQDGSARLYAKNNGTAKPVPTISTTGWRPTCRCQEDDHDGEMRMDEPFRAVRVYQAEGPYGELQDGADRETLTLSERESMDARGGAPSSAGRGGSRSESVPCTVLDPFMGSGTTALVARRLGRKSIGVELNPEYAALCARRLQQLSLFAGEPA